ncbi:MAG: hypothetical protein RR547_06100 [Raoultibacter sp.]
MSIKDTINRYRGQRDERIVAEMNKIYRVGFLGLSFGLLLFFVYELMRSQVALVNGLSETITISPAMTLLYLWLLIVSFGCSIAATRKGFMDEGRFAETDFFPAGYFSLWALGGGIASAFVIIILRMLAELELVGASGIMWMADIVIGIVFGVFIAFTLYVSYYLTFRAAKRRRETLAARFDD